MLSYVLPFLLLLGVLVVVHELGHFLAARYVGVKVLRFSVGFGPVIFRRIFGVDRTEWVVSAIPLGGYVKMLDEREGDVLPDEYARTFNRQSVGKRSLIVAAGPLANLLLAVLLYWLVFMLGSQELLPVIAEPEAGTPAAAAGLRDGEQIQALNGRLVLSWNDLRWEILHQAASDAEVELDVINAQREIRQRRLSLAAIAEGGWEGEAFDKLGLRLYRPFIPPVIGRVAEGSVAEQAGLHAGDIVLAISGQEISSWQAMVTRIRDSAGQSILLDIERDGALLRFELVPQQHSEGGRSFGRIGVAVAEPQNMRDLRTFVRYGPLDAFSRAVSETWEKTSFSFAMFGRMLLGEISWKNISGPVTIADYAGQSARLGLDYYLKFMALVSISLGVLNLLPIPVLDGGHLMYHMIEVIRRKPLSDKAVEIAQRIGLSLLFALMAFAFFNDMNRLVSG